jgi:hypothetical protein
MRDVPKKFIGQGFASLREHLLRDYDDIHEKPAYTLLEALIKHFSLNYKNR